MGTELNAKPHYLILDGLRGIAAILVVFFHLFEAHSSGHLDQVINHGYLAVDFFFVFSGFVVGYAYDDRWNKMTIGAFFLRRLIRLSGRRMETGRSATEARVYPSDVSVFRRVVIIPDRFPDPDKICF